MTKPKTGPQGPPRTPGVNGKNGVKGETGALGEKGQRGESRTSGIHGTPGVMSYKIWKMWAWKNLNDGKDQDLIKVSLFCVKRIYDSTGPQEVSFFSVAYSRVKD